MKAEKGEVLLRIIDVLNKGSLPISDISDKIGSNWETTKTNLDVLLKLGIIDLKEAEGKKLYYLKMKAFSDSRNTLFKLPITEKGKQVTHFLFKNIKKIWNEKVGKPIEKTRIHKYAVDICKQFALEAPHVWYKYGELMLEMYDEQSVYETDFAPQNSAEILRSIAELIEDTKGRRVSDLEAKQYRKNRLYALNVEISGLLAKECTAQEINNIRELLYSLLVELKTDRREDANLVNDSISVFLWALKQNKATINRLRSKLITAYNDVWSLIALMNLYKSLLELDVIVYPKEVLDVYIDFSTARTSVEQSVLELTSNIPEVEVINDFPIISQLRGAAK